MELDPRTMEEASEEYFLKRTEFLKHFTLRYEALNPEIDSELETAHDYSDLGFDDEIGDAPENVRQLAYTLNWDDDFSYEDLVRNIQNRIAWEAGSLMVLKEEEYDVSEKVEERISEALNYVVDVMHQDFHREEAETPEEKAMLGSEAEYIVHEGELIPLPVDVKMSYNSVKGEDEVAENFDSAVTPNIDMESFFEKSS